MITKDGTITTVAGTPTQSGYSGDEGLATAALLKHPGGIAFDLAGNLYIADTDNNVVEGHPERRYLYLRWRSR